MHRSGTNPGATGCSCLQAGPCPRKDSQAWLQEPAPASPGGKSMECEGRSQNPKKNNPPNSHYGAPVPQCAMAWACQLYPLFITLALTQLQLDNLQCRPGNQSTLFTQPKLYHCIGFPMREVVFMKPFHVGACLPSAVLNSVSVLAAQAGGKHAGKSFGSTLHLPELAALLT